MQVTQAAGNLYVAADDISLFRCHCIVGLQAFIKNDNSHTYPYSSLKG